MISLCLIVKNERQEIQKAKECVESCGNYVDEICITLNGKDNKLKAIPREFKKYRVSYFKWKDDFSACRTFNFKQAKGDWILWLDADDVLRGAENLKTIIDEAEKHNVSGVWVNYWYQVDRNGVPWDIHPKIQIIRNDGSFKWSAPVHENLIPTRPSVKMEKTEILVRVHKYGLADSSSKAKRNLEIMLRKWEAEKDNPDPRDLIYLGKTLLILGDLDRAEAFLLQYIPKSGWKEEIYEAYMLLGEIYRRKRDWEHARIAYLNGLKLLPEYPDAYHGMALTYLGEKNYHDCITWTETGLSKKIQESGIAIRWSDLTWRPLNTYAVALLNVGRLEEAETAIKSALKLNNQEENLFITRDIIQDTKEKRDIARNFRLIASYLQKTEETEKIMPLIGAIPSNLQDNIFISSVKNEFLKPKIWGKNEIAVYCPKTVEEWSPENIKRGGIGGSETAIIELSKRLQQLGWKITVYNWCSIAAGVYDGVVYRNFWEINWKDEFNILWVWRYPELFDLDLKAKKTVLDLHDVGYTNEYTPERLKKIGRIFVKTKAHRELYPEISDDKFVIVNNGIDPNRFKKRLSRNPHRLIYLSTVDRGLELLLRLFPEIKKVVPDAELHLFYGFKTFYELEKDNPIKMRQLYQIEKKINETAGVINHGRVDQWTLAEEIQKSALWVYPTGFYEIGCIAAMEAQAGGAIPVTSNYAALKEVVQFGVKIEGENHTQEYQKRWLEEVISLLKDKNRQEKIRKKMIPYALKEFDWDRVAEKWDKELKK